MEDKFLAYLQQRDAEEAARRQDEREAMQARLEEERRAADAREKGNKQFFEEFISKMQDAQLEEQAKQREASDTRDLRSKTTPVRPMEDRADVVEFMEIFECNMEARKIPKDV